MRVYVGLGGGCEEGAGGRIRRCTEPQGGRNKNKQNPDSFTFRGSFDGYFLCCKTEETETQTSIGRKNKKKI